jgi:hypothetical protein
MSDIICLYLACMSPNASHTPRAYTESYWNITSLIISDLHEVTDVDIISIRFDDLSSRCICTFIRPTTRRESHIASDVRYFQPQHPAHTYVLEMK